MTVSFTKQHGIYVHGSSRAYSGRWLSSLSLCEMQHQYAANSQRYAHIEGPLTNVKLEANGAFSFL